MKSKKFYLAVFLPLLLGWYWYNHLKKPQKPHASQSSALRLTVSIAKPHQQSVKRYIDTVGQCVAYNQIALVSKATATLVTVKSSNGGSVQKGDVLFQFNESAPKAALQQAEAQFALDQAKHDLNVLQLKRSEGLRAQNFVSQQEYDTYQANVSVSQAQLEMDRALIAQRKIDLDDRTLLAPFAGEISKSEVDEGSYVNQGTTLAVLNQLQPIYVDSFLSERHLQALLKANRNEIEIEARLIDDPSVVQKGKLVSIGNTVEKSTGTFDIRGEFANEMRQFWPGRSMDLKIYYETIHNALLIPESAIHEGIQGEFVYIVNDQGLAEMKPVTTEQTYNHWIVVHGLNGNEQVITDGHTLLAPGMPINTQKLNIINPPASLQTSWHSFSNAPDVFAETLDLSSSKIFARGTKTFFTHCPRETGCEKL